VPFINLNAIPRSSRAAAALLVTFAAAPMLLSAVCHADPDPDPAVPIDPRAQCESADVMGVFITTTTPDAVVHSECQYIVSGLFYYDNYDNGAYTGTLVYWDGAKVPTERPAITPLLVLPNLPYFPQF
jgi:hypothetical protein